MHRQVHFEDGEAKQRLTQSTSPSPIQAKLALIAAQCHGQWLHKKPFFFIVSVFLWHWHLPDPASAVQSLPMTPIVE